VPLKTSYVSVEIAEAQVKVGLLTSRAAWPDDLLTEAEQQQQKQQNQPLAIYHP
jgi:hypothetical protein